MDELNPMEQRNEPSTAEIVKALRDNVSDYYPVTAAVAADCIERLERENAEKDVQIAALTARAESAERERDAAVNALTLYEDALFDECDKSYQSGFMDGFRSREGIDDED